MEEIINSVMQSPENTNPNVLRSQLQKMGGSGASDYSNLENTPISLIKGAKTYTNADQIGEVGTWPNGDFTMAVKIMEPLSIDDLKGYILTLKLKEEE